MIRQRSRRDGFFYLLAFILGLGMGQALPTVQSRPVVHVHGAASLLLGVLPFAFLLAYWLYIWKRGRW